MEELPKNYDAKIEDPKWLKFWNDHDLFKVDVHSKKPSYCIVIPPPNVTGVLHMGHALVNTLQDILIRWKRMSGFEALWVPGTDHAGISTQTVVEKHVIKTRGKKRTDFSREEFLSFVWEWKELNESLIVSQLKRIGSSCDWSRQRFTMDEGNNKAVRAAFKKLFDAGLIYKGDYLVNWDPITQTAIADDEVEYEEKSSFLWHFKYPLKDGSGYAVIATTRPETMLGDTAVAVSPKDPRYADWIGKTLILPLMNREIPLIADHRVDPAFGTGMVKITPAHDPNDYQMGLDHHLPFINIMTKEGKINENGGRFVGLTMEEARKAVVEAMKQEGLLVKVEPHQNRVGISYRSKAVIEPYMSKQWFVKMSSFKDKLRSAVLDKRVELIPAAWENTYLHWIENLRDWCISRQLWWGHRIPVWYHSENPDEMLCYAGDGVPPEVEKEPDAWVQDEDVLDTWFSSALWPFATLGWPEATLELKRFYPNSVLVTGHDILFFWVARMILMGEYLMEEAPFPQTFLHGLVYGKSYWRQNKEGGISYIAPDERHEYELGKAPPPDVFSRWEKMSKTKGNVIDPLEIIDIYGTDAMRMALTASVTHARELDLDLRRFEEFKNFANKIWNGARFVLMNLSPSLAFGEGIKENELALEDQWILSKLNRTIDAVNHHLATYTFDQSALQAYDFFWKEFCAYYVEIVKPTLFGKAGGEKEKETKQKVLTIVLSNAIRLLHPMAPFITEELFCLLKNRLSWSLSPQADLYTKETAGAMQSLSCMVAPYPQALAKPNEEVEKAFAQMDEVVYTIRNIRGEMKLPPGAKTDLYVWGEKSDPLLHLIKENILIINSLVRLQNIHFVEKDPSLPFAATGTLHALKILIPLPEELLNKEKERLEKEAKKLQSQIERLQIQLGNPDFTEKAPAALIQTQQDQLKKQQIELESITSQIKKFDLQ